MIKQMYNLLENVHIHPSYVQKGSLRTIKMTQNIIQNIAICGSLSE